MPARDGAFRGEGLTLRHRAREKRVEAEPRSPPLAGLYRPAVFAHSRHETVPLRKHRTEPDEGRENRRNSDQSAGHTIRSQEPPNASPAPHTAPAWPSPRV